MDEQQYFKTVRETIYPKFYPKEVFATETEFMVRDGNYVFYCLPAANIDYSDLTNKAIKRAVRDKVFCLPFLIERGLFVHAYGAQDQWQEGAKNLKVDKIALKPVILQNINFIDPSSGESFNNRTSWGKLKFGFCGKVIEALDALAGEIGNEAAGNWANE